MMPRNARNELTAPVWLTELAIFLIVLAVMFSGAPVAVLAMPIRVPVVVVVVRGFVLCHRHRGLLVEVFGHNCRDFLEVVFGYSHKV